MSYSKTPSRICIEKSYSFADFNSTGKTHRNHISGGHSKTLTYVSKRNARDYFSLNIRFHNTDCRQSCASSASAKLSILKFLRSIYEVFMCVVSCENVAFVDLWLKCTDGLHSFTTKKMYNSRKEVFLTIYNWWCPGLHTLNSKLTFQKSEYNTIQ